MVDLVNVRDAGAVEGVDCTALLTETLTAGAPGLYFPAGSWVVNDLELTSGGRSRVAVRGAGPAVTQLTTSVPAAGALKYTAPIAQEAFIEVSDLQLCNGLAYPDQQAGCGLAIRGPAGGEIGKGRYSNLWSKNFWAAIYLERHNNATVVDLIAEYGNAALYAVDCGDLELSRVKAQNGAGWAIQIHGTEFGRTTHMAEGARIVGCSSNSNVGGLLVDGYGFVNVATSSFSSAPAGALYLNDAWECSVVGGEWQAGDGVVAVRVMEGCRRGRFIGMFTYGSYQGLRLAGSEHTVVGLHATGNQDVDVLLCGTGCVLDGGQLLSTGAANSLMEDENAGTNRINAVHLARGLHLRTGGGSVCT